MTNEQQGTSAAKKTKASYTPAQRLERAAVQVEMLKFRVWEKPRKDAQRALEALTQSVTGAPVPVPTRIEEMYGEAMIAMKNVIRAIEDEQKSVKQHVIGG